MDAAWKNGAGYSPRRTWKLSLQSVKQLEGRAWNLRPKSIINRKNIKYIFVIFYIFISYDISISCEGFHRKGFRGIIRPI